MVPPRGFILTGIHTTAQNNNANESILIRVSENTTEKLQTSGHWNDAINVSLEHGVPFAPGSAIAVDMSQLVGGLGPLAGCFVTLIGYIP